MDVFEIDGVDELFAGSVEEFVAARDALVKELKAEKRKDDAAAVKALRKPSAAAWAINQIARVSAHDVEAMFTSAAAAHAAQAKAMQGRDDGSLRTTTRDWRNRLQALASKAGPHRDDALVAFEAASVDEAIAAIVRAGRLIAVPEASGFGGLAGMPEPVTRGAEVIEPDRVHEAEPQPDHELEAKIAEAEKVLEKATHRLRRAEQRLDQAKADVNDAEATRAEAAERLRRLIG